VADVMRVDEAVLVAARETATTVARLQGAAQRGWYGSGLAPDIEGIARLVFGYA
jgi:hypothetical protein